MNILVIGDVVGNPGRTILKKALPLVFKKYEVDYCIANVENAAGGFGVTKEVCDELLDAGVDCMTSGNHMATLNLSCRVFMNGALDDPFKLGLQEVERLRQEAKVIVVDIHGEASSEKTAIGHYLDGRVSAVLGTHTHVPTCDHRILPKGTAYCTDLGMTGPYDSVIGVEKDLVILRFLTGMPSRFETAKGDPRFAAAVVDVDPETGRARSIERMLLG